MRIEKKLKQEVVATDKKILEEGQSVKHSLMNDYSVSSEGTAAVKSVYKRNSALISVSCILLVLLVAGLIWWTFPKKQEVRYLLENEVTFDTTLEEIYDVIDVRINENNFAVTFPQRVEDSVSGDKLYYTIRIESAVIFPYGKVYFVTNKYYTLSESVEYLSQAIWNGYRVNYMSRPGNSDGIPILTISGIVEYNQLRIYFSYTDIDFGEEINPSAFLDSLIKLYE